MKTKTYTTKDWRKYFDDIGLPNEHVLLYMKYVEHMHSINMPVIFEFNHLCALLGRTPKYLASVINSPKDHYLIFNIPKRKKGKTREISAPYPALLECQQWINRHIISNIKISNSAHGFVKNRSIVSNATKHIDQNCLLKIDLQDFFPSITFRQVMKVFRDIGYPKNISFYLSSLCCLDGVLPQGAATSPGISNVVAKRLDARLSGLSKKCSLNYTRYADDIAMSGDKIPLKLIKIVEQIVDSEGFKINKEKTILSRCNSKRIVTGLSVSTHQLRLPREYKRRLRQEAHFVMKYGLLSHVSKMKIRDPFYIDTLYGKLCFWHYIEPECEFASNAIRHIKEIKTGFYRSLDMDIVDMAMQEESLDN